MTTSGISDQSSPDSIKVGAWLFRHRTAIPIPIALALLLVRASETPWSPALMAAGIVLTSSGELLRLWAIHHIGVISRTRSDRLGPLIASGPFALSRNPLYVGNIMLWVGFALTARLVWMAPIIGLLLGIQYHAIVRWEEQRLESRHGETYRAYAAGVARWLPGLVGPAGRGTGGQAGLFSLRETLFSERGTLLAIGAGYLLLWLKTTF